MGLGILESSKVETVPGSLFAGLPSYRSLLILVPGTAFIYDDASRPMHGGQPQSRRLKYGSGPVPVILVPQPSDDPNDPLVRKKRVSNETMQTLTEAELAIMEARLGTLFSTLFCPRAYVPVDSSHSIHPFNHRLHIESPARCKYCHASVALRQELYGDGACHRLSSPWSWCGRLPFCSFRQGLGQAPSISARHHPHHYLQRLGRCHWNKLQKLVVGKNHPRGRTGPFRSLGQR